MGPRSNLTAISPACRKPAGYGARVSSDGNKGFTLKALLSRDTSFSQSNFVKPGGGCFQARVELCTVPYHEANLDLYSCRPRGFRGEARRAVYRWRRVMSVHVVVGRARASRSFVSAPAKRWKRTEASCVVFVVCWAPLFFHGIHGGGRASKKK